MIFFGTFVDFFIQVLGIFSIWELLKLCGEFLDKYDGFFASISVIGGVVFYCYKTRRDQKKCQEEEKNSRIYHLLVLYRHLYLRKFVLSEKIYITEQLRQDPFIQEVVKDFKGIIFTGPITIMEGGEELILKNINIEEVLEKNLNMQLSQINEIIKKHKISENLWNKSFQKTCEQFSKTDPEGASRFVYLSKITDMLDYNEVYDDHTVLEMLDKNMITVEEWFHLNGKTKEYLEREFPQQKKSILSYKRDLLDFLKFFLENIVNNLPSQAEQLDIENIKINIKKIEEFLLGSPKYKSRYNKN